MLYEYLFYHRPYKNFFILITALMNSTFIRVFYVSVFYHCLCCVFFICVLEVVFFVC